MPNLIKSVDVSQVFNQSINRRNLYSPPPYKTWTAAPYNVLFKNITLAAVNRSRVSICVSFLAERRASSSSLITMQKLLFHTVSAHGGPKNWGAGATLPCDIAWPCWNTPIRHTCYHTESDRSRSSGIHVGKGYQTFWRRWGPAPLGWKAWLIL